MKVIHFPTSVGGMSWELAQGERKLGIDSKVYSIDTNPFEYNSDFGTKSKRKIAKALELYYHAIRFSREYDVFHMNSGSSMIDYMRFGVNYWDLPLYKGKKICVTFNGCDARQKYKRQKVDEYSACNYDDCYGGVCCNPNLEKKKQHRIDILDRHGVTFFTVNPDLLMFLPERTVFLPYALDIDRISPAKKTTNDGRFRIIHAPSDRGCKGTEDIISVVEKIKKKHPTVELIIIEGVKHSDALQMYKEADLVIDQIRVGWYGALAAETMGMGIPTIAYINQDDIKRIPGQMAHDCMEAVISANKDNLFDTLDFLLNNPEQLRHRSEASIEFVRKWHDSRYVATITKEQYES